jgi:hypothetical protein
MGAAPFHPLPFLERMVNMQEFKIGSKKSDELLKVELNEYGDYIVLNTADATFADRYSNFLRAMEEMDAELSQKAEEYSKQFAGKDIVSRKEDGDVDIDTEQLMLYVELQNDMLTRAVQKIDDLFGAGTIRKYFRNFYELNPNFVPDDECLKDFLEEISKAVNMAYDIRSTSINQKYNKNRRGGGKHSKSKEELLEEAKKAADVND